MCVRSCVGCVSVPLNHGSITLVRLLRYDGDDDGVLSSAGKALQHGKEDTLGVCSGTRTLHCPCK